VKFHSTRNSLLKASLTEAIERGLAPDGGLYVPERFPQISESGLENKTLDDLSLKLLAPFFKDDPSERNLENICSNAFNFEAPLVEIKPGLKVLELFHGPTAAFKDFGARFLAQFFKTRGLKTIVLVATSGDTGGAVAAAFNRQQNIDVVVLFPENGVSSRQRHQLTCWGENIHSYSVRGSFDDCQALVKDAIKSWGGTKRLSSANSINLGRLLPQVVYYALASLKHKASTGRAAHFVIPTGNLGNAIACLWAFEMGFPVKAVTLACNANSAISDFFKTGEWKPQKSIRTLANAMDVGAASNMERLLNLYPEPLKARVAIDAHSVSDSQIKESISFSFKNWGLTVCPHTATAVDYYLKNPDPDTILVSTAHPAKFESVVEPLTQQKIALPHSLKSIENLNENFESIDASLEELTKRLKSIDIK
jgi:threonine synthase